MLDDDGGIAASCGSSRSRALPAATLDRSSGLPGACARQPGTTGNATVTLDPPVNLSHQLLYRCRISLVIENDARGVPVVYALERARHARSRSAS